MEDACSGLNSIIGLTAMGLLYVFLTRGSSLLYSLLLIPLIIPIAVAANIVRVTMLVLATYFLGDETAQGIFHVSAGIVLFATALMLIFAVDKALHLALRRRTPTP
jgi:exosortase